MIIIPPRHYCVVENPAVRKEGSNDPQAVVRVSDYASISSN
jgi:hypothetical protein